MTYLLRRAGWISNSLSIQTVLIAHVAARVGGLIVLPSLVYLLSFYIHFAVLTKTGPGDAQMSSLFQANLEGTEVGKNSPLEVAYGSRVTLKNMGYGGGLLHSHVQYVFIDLKKWQIILLTLLSQS